MTQFIKVTTTDELEDQQAKLVEVEGQKIALFRVGEAFYALSDTCTHRGGPLSEGTVEGAEVTCPWHGARFDIKTGAVLGPPAGREVRSYPVRVTGGRGRDRDVKLSLQEPLAETSVARPLINPPVRRCVAGSVSLGLERQRLMSQSR